MNQEKILDSYNTIDQRIVQSKYRNIPSSNNISPVKGSFEIKENRLNNNSQFQTYNSIQLPRIKNQTQILSPVVFTHKLLPCSLPVYHQERILQFKDQINSLKRMGNELVDYRKTSNTIFNQINNSSLRMSRSRFKNLSPNQSICSIKSRKKEKVGKSIDFWKLNKIKSISKFNNTLHFDESYKSISPQYNTFESKFDLLSP